MVYPQKSKPSIKRGSLLLFAFLYLWQSNSVDIEKCDHVYILFQLLCQILWYYFNFMVFLYKIFITIFHF